MSKAIYDAIIVGAGHNGLVAANYLAKANKRVLVLEQRPLVGGAAMTEELIPNFKFSRFSYVLSLFRKQIIAQLGLKERGLRIHYRDVSSLSPTYEVDKYLLFHTDPAKTLAEISKFSKKDAENWPRYEAYLSKFCRYWDRNLDHVPINYVKNPSLFDKAAFAKRAIDTSIDYFEFGKFVTRSVQQMLDSWFQGDLLKAALATDGIIGENLSVADHQTAYVLLHHVMGQLQDGKAGAWGYVEGGNGRLSEILADAAREKSVQIKTNVKVEQIIHDGERARAVRTYDGQTFQAKHIISNCTSQVTFMNLMKEPEKILTPTEYQKIKHTKYNGAATKLNIALKALPKFKSFRNIDTPLDQLLQGTIHINCNSIDQLKTSYNQTRHSRMSMNPFMDITIPSVLDKSLCPEGYHIMNVLLQYTPYHSNCATSTSEPISHSLIRELFIHNMNEYLDEPLQIHHMDILTPHDLEKILSLTEGNIFHGSIGLQNLYTNRLSGRVGGVWMCGSASHPGGGVMGVAGKNVVRQILRGR